MIKNKLVLTIAIILTVLAVITSCATGQQQGEQQNDT